MLELDKGTVLALQPFLGGTGVTGQQESILLVDGNSEVILARGQLLLANENASYFLAPLSLRAVKLQAQEIEPEEERHILEFKKPVFPGSLEIQQYLVAVEFDLPAHREVAVERNLVEFGRSV